MLGGSSNEIGRLAKLDPTALGRACFQPAGSTRKNCSAGNGRYVGNVTLRADRL